MRKKYLIAILNGDIDMRGRTIVDVLVRLYKITQVKYNILP